MFSVGRRAAIVQQSIINKPRRPTNPPKQAHCSLRTRRGAAESGSKAAVGLCWIGGQRVGEEWTWSDGTPWDFEHWSPGEPDNKHNRQAHLTINWWRPEEWDDDYYDSPGVQGFTCQT